MSKSGENKNPDLGKNSTSEIGRNPSPGTGKNPNSEMVERTFFGSQLFKKQKLERNSILKIEEVSIPEIGKSSGSEMGKNAFSETPTFEILPQMKDSNLGPQTGSTTQISTRNPVGGTKSSMEYLGNRVFEQREIWSSANQHKPAGSVKRGVFDRK